MLVAVGWELAAQGVGTGAQLASLTLLTQSSGDAAFVPSESRRAPLVPLLQLRGDEAAPANTARS
eukprot:SAG11_NODE_36524_length_261_cov_0.635802_1_plen_64_part_10